MQPFSGKSDLLWVTEPDVRSSHGGPDLQSGFLPCVTCLAGCGCPCWWGDTHAYPLVFAQPQSRDESIRCAELEEQIWQMVTLVRKHNPVSGEMMGGQGHPYSQEQKIFAQSQTRSTVSLLTPEKNLGLENY